MAADYPTSASSEEENYDYNHQLFEESTNWLYYIEMLLG